VDYAGQTVPLIDRHTGEVRQAQIFVGVIGASSYTYAEATWDQSISSYVGSHVRAFSLFGGVPPVLVPDNLKSGVSKAFFTILISIRLIKRWQHIMEPSWFLTRRKWRQGFKS